MSNAEQEEFWSDRAGPIWVAQMAAMDAALAPVLDAVMHLAALEEGEHVLDVGCGAGTSSSRASAAVGPAGGVLGIDISRSLLEVAQDQAQEGTNIRYVLADAQSHSFDAGAFDVLLSRFGVMFFENSQAAFANMAQALRPGGRVAFAAWGPIPGNPFFTLPAAVNKQIFPPMPKSDPDAPGPFSFRDANHVRGVLSGAGLVEVEIDEVSLMLTPQGDAAAVAALMCQIGPAQSALAHFEAGPDKRTELMEALIAALAPFDMADGIRIPAVLNMCAARKPA